MIKCPRCKHSVKTVPTAGLLFEYIFGIYIGRSIPRKYLQSDTIVSFLKISIVNNMPLFLIS